MSAAAWDDKILCGCGRPNPMIEMSELHGKAFIGAHVKRFLAPATRAEYVRQETTVDLGG